MFYAIDGYDCRYQLASTRRYKRHEVLPAGSLDLHMRMAAQELLE
jgi:hypothetical protein